MPRWPKKDDATQPTPKTKKGPRLKNETRAYTVDEAELSEWLTGGTLFHIKKIEVLSSGAIEFTVTTEKQAERTIVERFRTVNETRRDAGLPPIEEAEQTGPEVIEEGDGSVGRADAEPMIASRTEVSRKRLKSHRELVLEAQKQGTEPPVSHITHREDDDPVPSAVPPEFRA